MNPQLKKWQHGAIAVGLLLLCLFLLYASIVHPAVAGREEFRERLVEMRFQHAKLTESVRQIEALKSELKQLRGAQTDKAGFLEEKPRALAAADLQKHIKTLIETNGGNLVSTQVVHKKADDEKPFPEVSIKVHMRSDMAALRTILYRLASEQPVLLIRELYLQSRSQYRGRRNRGRRHDTLLETRFEITGFLYQSASS